MSLDLYYFGLSYVSATFATAFTNTIPAITFILAVSFRMESLSIKQKHGMAKVLGSAIGLSGALLCSFVRGPPMYAESKTKILNLSEKHYSKADWLKGSLVMLAANIIWSLWLIMQGPLIKQYPAKLRLTALQCFCSCVSSAVWAVVKERSPESWKLGWNVNLLSVFYCGVIVAGFTYWLQVWVVEKKGPVFTAVFSPLALILTAIFSAILFKETLHWGSVCGAIMLVIGLYAILWGKNNEKKAETSENEEKIERSEEKPENNEEIRTLESVARAYICLILLQLRFRSSPNVHKMESLSTKQRHGMVKVLGFYNRPFWALLYTSVRVPPIYGENKTRILNLSKSIIQKLTG
ncbi:WAT1-related protein [Forsythia ovata]|uniref:WAT1-related protein n=1 Tax=Forsythia ovata TaxID=205694 RepID=A0ABD1PX44_9LAMI